MRKDKIRVFYKRPGKKLVEVEIPNELEWIQGAVEGYFQHVQIAEDFAMLCNEEGKLNNMQLNFYCTPLNDWIFGPVLFVGVDGADYTDCPISKDELVKIWGEIDERTE